MIEKTFADRYRSAGLAPDPELIQRRQGACEALSSALTFDHIIDLVKLYYGLAQEEGVEWFQEAFHKEDTSFSMIANEREIVVLAACILAEQVLEGNDFAILATITTNLCGKREQPKAGHLLADAHEALTKKAILQRDRALSSAGTISVPRNAELATAIDDELETPQPASLAELLKQLYDQSTKVSNSLGNQIGALISTIETLQEETSILWWHIGAWSRLLEKPFSTLSPAVGSAMAGFDMADLSLTPVGPAAARPLLQRTIEGSWDAVPESVLISEAVDPLIEDGIGQLNLQQEIKGFPEVCPILTAYLRASEVGESPAWKSSYQKVSGLDADTSFSPLELSLQIYQERSLTAAYCSQTS